MPKLDVRNSKLGEAASAIPRIRDFTDLDVWQLARSFKNDVYRVVQEFPREERFALGPQLRRSVISITANIAEGFGRYSFQENIQFCRLARGSAYEARDHLITARDQALITNENYQRLDALAQRVIQTLNGYIRSTQARQKAKMAKS